MSLASQPAPVPLAPRPLRERIIPLGLAARKPRHFREMAAAVWENRDALGYAWQVLSRGVCDGCALGVAGLRDCTAQALAATPRCVWNPDIDSPVKYMDGWTTVPDQGVYDNAFKVQWELFLKHVVKDDPFPWDLMQGAKGVQMAGMAGCACFALI